KQLAKQKSVALDGVVVLDGSAGVGTADVVTIPGIVAAAVEPDWDWIAEEVEDPAAAGKALLAAIARRGKPVGRVDVPSGKLAMACGWSDMTGYAAPLQRMKPGAGTAKPLEEDGLVLGVRPGT